MHQIWGPDRMKHSCICRLFDDAIKRKLISKGSIGYYIHNGQGSSEYIKHCPFDGVKLEGTPEE